MPKGQSPFDVKMLTINVMVQRVRDCVYLWDTMKHKDDDR